VSGASRLVSGIIQLAFLAFGIVAGIRAVGVWLSVAFEGSNDLLGEWAPWLGVLVFAGGLMVSNSARTVVPRAGDRAVLGCHRPAGREHDLRWPDERVRWCPRHDPRRVLGTRRPRLCHRPCESGQQSSLGWARPEQSPIPGALHSSRRALGGGCTSTPPARSPDWFTACRRNPDHRRVTVGHRRGQVRWLRSGVLVARRSVHSRRRGLYASGRLVS